MAKQLLGTDAKFYLCISIYYLYGFTFNMHCMPRGFFCLEFIPFFISRLCICCTLKMSHKPKKKKYLKQKLWEKQLMSCRCLNKTELPVISQEPDLNIFPHIAEPKNNPLLSM